MTGVLGWNLMAAIVLVIIVAAMVAVIWWVQRMPFRAFRQSGEPLTDGLPDRDESR